jgi:8-oxo-dGTP pyrophosphatase MutT (NUDIX family)
MADNGSSPQQAAAIPFRRVGESVQVCLIRRKDSVPWGIPKGIIDPGETSGETALNETWEEAGLRGRLIGDAIGTYRYEKWGVGLTVAVHLLEVLQEEASWRESGVRERRWTSCSEAVLLLSDHPVQPLLDYAIRFLAALTGTSQQPSSGADALN